MLFTRWLKGLAGRISAARKRRSGSRRGIARAFSRATSPVSWLAAPMGGVPTCDLAEIVERLEDRALLASNVTITTAATSGGTFADVGGVQVFTPTDATANADRDDIQTFLNAGTSVRILTASGQANAGTLGVNDSITKSAGAEATLTLLAVDNLTFQSGSDILSTADQLNVTFTGDSDGTGTGNIVINSSKITTNGGDVVVNGADLVDINGGATDFVTAGGSYTVNADTDADGTGTYKQDPGGSTVGTGSGAVSITAADIDLVGTITSGAANISLIPSTLTSTIGLGGTVGSPPAGAFVLTEAEMGKLSSSGTVTVGKVGGSGAVQIKALSLSGETYHVTIRGGATTFIGATTLPNDKTLTLDTGAITSPNTGTDVTIGGTSTLSVTASGAIGTLAAPLTMSVANLTTNTSSGNHNQFLSAGTVTVAAPGLNAGTGTLALIVGTYKLGAADVIHDNSDVTVTSPSLLDLNDFDETIDALAGNGTVDNTAAGTATLTVGFNDGSATFSGVIQDTGGAVSLTKTGSGTQTLGGTNTYVGATTISAGTLLVNGSLANGTDATDVTVANGATLGGTGTINGVTSVSGSGTLAPGNSRGILNSSNLSLTSGSTFAVEIGGTNAGNAITNHDQLNVTGTVSLGNATLNLSAFNSFVPSIGNQFTILVNDSSDPIPDTFNGLVDGATISNFLGSGLAATISYNSSADGNDGNDVVLTVVTSVNLSVSPVSGTEAGQTVITVTLTADSAVSGDQTVDLAVSGTGITGSDYSLTDGAVTAGIQIKILNGQTIGTVTFTIVDDVQVEATETATLTISNPSASITLGTTLSQDVAITNNDTATYSIDNATIVEGGNLSFTVSLSNPVDVETKIDVSFTDGTTSADDFTHTTQQVTFAAGSTTAQGLMVATATDNTVEADETLTASLALSAALTGGRLSATTDTGSGTITNDDTATFRIDDVMVNESAGTMTFTISLSNSIDIEAKVNVTYADVSATGSGTDYDSTSDQVTFAANSTTPQTVTVTIIDDILVEPAETFTASLTRDGTTPLTGYATDLSDTGTGTIDLTDEGPIVADATFGVSENDVNATAVGTVVATGGTGSITFSITAGNTGDAFAIDAMTGAITVADATELDFEVTPTYSLTVQATDGTTPDTATITINVTNEAPVVADATFGITEGVATATSVGAVVLTGDTDSIVFSITGGNALGAFAIDAATGAITVADAADVNFEVTPQFVLTVQASDGATSDTATVTINLTNVGPTAVDNVATTGENTNATGNVLTNDTDPNGAAFRVSAVNGNAGSVGVAVPGSNGGTFTINANGSYTFAVGSDFDSLGVGEMQVSSMGYTALDTVALGGLNATATLTVTVTGTNDAPTVTATGAMVLSSVDANDNNVTAPNNGPAGNSVLDFLLPNVSDPDTNAALGMAITANPVGTTGGIWQFSVNGGTTWTAMPVVSSTDALHLQADGLTRVRLLPNGTNSGNGSLTFRAWDQTGTVIANGAQATVSPSGGINSHSANAGTARVFVLAASNDAPVAVVDAGQTVAEGATLTVSAASGVAANDTDQDAGAVLQARLASSPAHGTLTLNTSGSFTYLANGTFLNSLAAGVNSIESFTYRAFDGSFLSLNVATVSITVTGANDAPTVANAIPNQAATEDTAFSFAFAANAFADVDTTNTLTYTTSALPAWLTFNAGTRTFSGTPAIADVGTVSVTVTATDNAAAAVTDTFNIVVANVNDAPVAAAGTLSATEGTTATGTLSATDVDSASLTYSIVDQSGANGVVTMTDSATGAYSFAPAADFNGSASFTFKANDGALDSNTATITITVAAANDAPVATGTSASGDEDTGITGTVTATDVDGDTLTFAAGSTAPSNGAVAVNSDGSFTYTPATDFIGSDSFTVVANDGSADSNEATVTITVNPVNDAPVAADASASGDEGNDITGTVTATDVEGDALTFAAGATAPSNGSVVINADGSFTYTPAPDFSGSDSFTVVANDGSADSNEATVSITVNPVNDALVAADAAASGDEDTDISGTVTATDVDGDTLTFSAGATAPSNGSVTATDVAGDALTFTAGSTAPSNGAVVVNADGSFTYTPAGDFNGSDSFTVVANDGTVDSNEATVSITVNPVNDAPVTADAAASGDEDTDISGTVTATDVDGDTLTFAAGSTAPSNGAVVVNSDGSFTYTPAGDFNGSDSFTVVANDGTVDSNEAVVSITVNSVNDAPTATNATFSIAENSANGTVVGPVAIAIADVDGDPLTVTIDGGNFGNAFAISSTGEVTVANAAALNFEVTPVFTLAISVSDGNGGSATATVTINLNDVAGDSLLVDLSGTAIANTVNVRVIGAMLHAQDASGLDLVPPLVLAFVRDITIRGGSAVDTVTFEASLNGVYSGTIQVFGNGGNDILNASALTISVNDLQGNAGNDVITGGSGDDTLQGGAGRDRISGGAGHDFIRGQGGSDLLLDGGIGNDTVDGGIGHDVITGGVGDDQIAGGEGSDIIDGGADHDLIVGGPTSGDALAVPDNDSITGGAGNDTLIGGYGRDTLSGGTENDIVIGGANADSVDGGVGGDTVLGGNGGTARGGSGTADVGDLVTSLNAGVDIIDELFATLFDLET